MATFEIAPGRWVSGDHPCFVIAEIGQNHQGDISIAKKMIKTAKECGADCVKFQKCKLDQKFNKKALERPYESKNAWGPTYGEHKAFIEFSEEKFLEIKKYADEIGILFSSSAGDAMSMDFLDKIGTSFLEITSADAGSLSFVKHAALKGKPLVISTGMQSMDTVREVYRQIKKINPRFAILQCTNVYPMPVHDAHLNVIKSFKTEFPEVPIGYCGNENGMVAISIAAVTLGAKIIERHFTLDKTQKGTDHSASLEPQELKQLVDDVRSVEKALGTTEKRIQEGELPFKQKLGKTLVATRNLKTGIIIGETDLTGKVAEPKGISVEKKREVVGRKLKRCLAADESIPEEYVE